MIRPSKFIVRLLAFVLLVDLAIFAAVAERVSKYGIEWIWQPFL